MRLLQSGDFYPSSYIGALVRLAEITTDVATHYFSTQAVTYNGNDYLAGLIVDSPYKRYRSLQADAGDVKIANADWLTEGLLISEKFEGAQCTLLEYFVDLDDASELGRGILSEQTAGEDVVTWRMIPEFDFTGIVAADRNFLTTCSWRYKSDQCGSASGLATCPKTYSACVTRAATHRFNGFIQITRALTAVYPPPNQTGGGGYGGSPRPTGPPWMPVMP